MSIKKYLTATTLGAVLISSPAFAADIKLSGFLSAGVGKTLDDDTTFSVDPITGATYNNDDILFAPESMVALQAQSTITDQMRATVQVVAKGANDYNANVELAFLSYELTDNLTVNAGRFRLPLYFYSDYLDVGYAYHWIRPPGDVYSIPQSAIDGVNLRHSSYLGNSDVEIETIAWYGASDIPFGEDTTLEVRDDWGIAPTLTWDWLKVRLLHNSLQVGDFGSATYQALAFMADYNDFIWRSEISVLDSGGSETLSWYGSLGYQVGNFTPHITLSNSNPDESDDFNTFDPATFQATGLLDTEANSTTVGVRWDFHPSSALKLEYTTRTDESISTVKATNVATTVENDVSVISVSLDIIF
ncbi:hypothetical protein [Teredinibacter waterburyi]|uniref:hypothetical protein n=1 Tax=Teredinibacter waterburyi TaxID=1500538 RepID=UPI00165FC52B|nr:hypothetical protein [Teredinibacter waterburyi]